MTPAAIAPASQPAVVVPKPESAAVKKAPVEKVTLSFQSRPRALVRDAKTRAILGETPFDLSVEKNGEQISVVLTRDNYKDETVKLVADKDRRSGEIRLKRIPSARKRGPKQKKAEPKPTVAKKTEPPPVKKKKKKKKRGFGQTLDPLADD